jgi:hypothetical protein
MMPSALHFRNVDASPADAVETWPFEGVLAALERGTLPDWRRLVHAINADPWGTVARQVEEAQKLGLPYGVGALFAEAVKTARAQAARAEREAVAAEVRALVSSSGLTRPEFAPRIGTSASRLSTYMSQMDEYAAGTPQTAMPRRDAIATKRSRNCRVGIPQTTLRNHLADP